MAWQHGKRENISVTYETATSAAAANNGMKISVASAAAIMAWRQK